MIHITTPNRDEAISISRTLLHNRLIACANISDHVVSLYHWMGDIEQNSEAVIVAKTQSALVPQVIEKVKSVHSYDTPAIVSCVLGESNPDYIQWVIKETTPR
jgi:periplasmic divalent cation tolerance protein